MLPVHACLSGYGPCKHCLHRYWQRCRALKQQQPVFYGLLRVHAHSGCNASILCTTMATQIISECHIGCHSLTIPWSIQNIFWVCSHCSTRCWHYCYVRAERSAWLEQEGYDQVTLLVVNGASASGTQWEHSDYGSMGDTWWRGRGRSPRRTRWFRGSVGSAQYSSIDTRTQT